MVPVASPLLVKRSKWLGVIVKGNCQYPDLALNVAKYLGVEVTWAIMSLGLEERGARMFHILVEMYKGW